MAAIHALTLAHCFKEGVLPKELIEWPKFDITCGVITGISLDDTKESDPYLLWVPDQVPEPVPQQGVALKERMEHLDKAVASMTELEETINKDMSIMLNALKATNSMQVLYQTEPLDMANGLITQMNQNLSMIIQKLEIFNTDPNQRTIFGEQNE